jgi:AraC family transcriptional regulator
MRLRFDPVHMGSPRFRTREHGAFLVTDAWFPPGLMLTPHEHERPVIAVTLDGGWDSVMLRRPYACAPGTLLIEPAGERHSNHFGAAGGRVVILQPDLSTRDIFGSIVRAVDRPVAVGCTAAAQLARRMREEIDASDTASPLALEGLCLELLALTTRRVQRADGRPPRWLARALAFLHGHALEAITLARVAAAAGVHPAHLSREFRRHHQTSVASYVRGLRLAWAAERLADSERPIADIATEAGFADQSHFTRAFHRYSGQTPRAFRDRRSATVSR